jgi:hypothetical protein
MPHLIQTRQFIMIRKWILQPLLHIKNMELGEQKKNSKKRGTSER